MVDDTDPAESVRAVQVAAGQTLSSLIPARPADSKRHIRLTDQLRQVREDFQYRNLPAEFEARWRLRRGRLGGS